MRGKMRPFLDPAKRYRTFDSYLRERFGCKVYKVSLDAGFTCPNRDGTLGRGGCVFCSGRGSASPLIEQRSQVERQLARGIEFGKRRYKAQRFIAYFQAFTNTYAPVEQLRQLYDQAILFPEVVGLAIGTRPDCVTDETLDLLTGYTPEREVWIEYGLQSVHESTLAWMHRGHGAEAFFDAVHRTQGRGIKICAHVVFGFPVETPEQMLDTVRAIAPLRLDGIKIHALHVIRGTPLARLYETEGYGFLSQTEYVQIICDALELLPPETVIQRLTGEAPASELVGPHWTLRKGDILLAISQELKRRGTWQGSRFHSGTEIARQDGIPQMETS